LLFSPKNINPQIERTNSRRRRRETWRNDNYRD